MSDFINRADAPLPPGPWEWNKNRPERYDLDWLTDAAGNHLLTIYGNGVLTPTKQALSATPDLLAACKLAMEYMGDRPGPEKRGVNYDCIREVIDALTAAINKAEGNK